MLVQDNARQSTKEKKEEEFSATATLRRVIRVLPRKQHNGTDDTMSDIEKQYDVATPGGAKKSEEIADQRDGIDLVFEAKLVRKLDIYIIPVVMLLYLFSFLDR